MGMIKISEAKAKPSSGVVPLSPSVPKTFMFALAVLFFSASMYYLMMMMIWRDKTRRSSPLLKHLGQGEMAAILLAALASSLICSNLLGSFFTTIQEIEIVERWHQGAKVGELTVPIPKAEVAVMSDEEIAQAVSKGMVALHSLEAEVGGDCLRAARVRRKWVELFLSDSRGRLLSLEALPLSGFNYDSVVGQCCEMVIGYVQIPVGVAGPLLLDGYPYMLPLATTEGTLVASTNRGCKAIRLSGGATTTLLQDAITRAPVLRFPSASRAASLKSYLEHPRNFHHLARLFNSTSGYARLQSIKCALAGRNLYAQFACSTGDAMGMNMVTKSVQTVLSTLQQDFSDMEVVSISGNYCADKKAAAVNWIEGRGKSVVCEATIKGEVVSSMFKTSVSRLVELNTVKNLIGSCVAGALGGSNAHASNIVSALFIATGQDPAQNVESSQCLTLFEPANSAEDLFISVTMPCIEVGTIGGGTKLASQGACLDILGVKGANKSKPGENSQRLARIVAGAVLAGELSLMAAQATGDLVKSHMKYNRSSNK